MHILCDYGSTDIVQDNISVYCLKTVNPGLGLVSDSNNRSQTIITLHGAIYNLGRIACIELVVDAYIVTRKGRSNLTITSRQCHDFMADISNLLNEHGYILVNRTRNFNAIYSNHGHLQGSRHRHFSIYTK